MTTPPDNGPVPARRGEGPRDVVVLVSGTGTNLQALLDAAADPAYGAGWRPSAPTARTSRAWPAPGGPASPRSSAPWPTTPTREDWDAALTEQVAAYEPDLVVLAGFMRLTGAAFLAPVRRAHRQHPPRPAPRPSPGCTAPGTRSRTASRSPARRCSSSTPASTPGRSSPSGPCRCADDDTVESLHERIKAAERQMLVDCVGRMVRDGFTVSQRKVTIP